MIANTKAQPKSTQPQGRKSRSRYYAKKNRKASVKAATNRVPEKAYFSVCCSAQATKPRCGEDKVAVISTGDNKKQPKAEKTGLGHFRCSVCHKSCKVTVRKATVETPPVTEGAPVA